MLSRRDRCLFDAHYSGSMLTGQTPSVFLLSVSTLTSFILIPSRFLCLDLDNKLLSATSGSANPSLPNSRATTERFRYSQAVDDECLIAQPLSLINPLSCTSDSRTFSGSAAGSFGSCTENEVFINLCMTGQRNSYGKRSHSHSEHMDDERKRRRSVGHDRERESFTIG